MTRAVIADDEPLMREQLRARLSELWPELEIVAEAKNGVEAVEQVAALRPEVVFLDIRMPAKTGIEAAREIAALDGRLPQIVFVTAYDQYAIDAFEQGVIDYVLKPAERERLGVTVERLRRRLAAPSPSSDTLQQALARLAEKLEPASRLKWIQASVGNQIQMIPVEDRSEEHTSELQSLAYLVCRLLLEKKKETILSPAIYKNKKKTKIKPNHSRTT